MKSFWILLTHPFSCFFCECSVPVEYAVDNENDDEENFGVGVDHKGRRTTSFDATVASSVSSGTTTDQEAPPSYPLTEPGTAQCLSVEPLTNSSQRNDSCKELYHQHPKCVWMTTILVMALLGVLAWALGVTDWSQDNASVKDYENYLQHATRQYFTLDASVGFCIRANDLGTSVYLTPWQYPNEKDNSISHLAKGCALWKYDDSAASSSSSTLELMMENDEDNGVTAYATGRCLSAFDQELFLSNCSDHGIYQSDWFLDDEQAQVVLVNEDDVRSSSKRQCIGYNATSATTTTDTAPSELYLTDCDKEDDSILVDDSSASGSFSTFFDLTDYQRSRAFQVKLQAQTKEHKYQSRNIGKWNPKTW